MCCICWMRSCDKRSGGELLSVYSNPRTLSTDFCSWQLCGHLCCRRQALLAICCEVLDLRSCKWRLQTICRQKSSLIEFRTSKTPNVVVRELFSVLHFIWAEDRISQHCPQCTFRVGGCIQNVRGLLQGYRVLHLWIVMCFLPRKWKERPNNRESVTKTF